MVHLSAVLALLFAFPQRDPYDSEKAVLAAQKWLSRHQNADGSWGTTNYIGRCVKACGPNPGHDEFDAGVTGLALLSFLGSGYSHRSKDTYDRICFGDVVRKGLQWILSRQDLDGCLADTRTDKSMYNHAICAMALAEAYELTGSFLIKDQAQKAIDYLVSAQNPGKAWRYSHRSGDNDTSVTGWAMMALLAARRSGLKFPKSALDGVRAWLDEVTDAQGRAGYTRKGTGLVFLPGH